MNETPKIDPDKVVGIYFDEEKKEQLIFTKDQLINQIKRICPVIAESFDKVYDVEFRQLSEEISSILPLQFVGFKTAIEQKDEVRICAGNLLRNASNTLISAIDLLRDGFRLQSGILLRSIIEICATVVHIIVDPKALSDFNNGTLNSTYSISFANKQIPLFGKAWGLMSNFHIHINTAHADWYPMNQYTNKEEIPSSVVIGIMGYTLLVLDIVTELCYLDELEAGNYWTELKPGQMQFIPPKEERTAWMEQLLKDKKK